MLSKVGVTALALLVLTSNNFHWKSDAVISIFEVGSVALEPLEEHCSLVLQNSWICTVRLKFCR